VADQVREFCALLDEVAPGEAFDLVPEARDPEKLREHVARITEAQSLIKVGGEKVASDRS
jgi:hypothetical protein